MEEKRTGRQDFDYPVVHPCDTDISLILTWGENNEDDNTAITAVFHPREHKILLSDFLARWGAACNALEINRFAEVYNPVAAIFEHSVSVAAETVELPTIVRAVVYFLCVAHNGHERNNTRFVCCIMASLGKVILSSPSLSITDLSSTFAVLIETCCWSCARGSATSVADGAVGGDTLFEVVYTCVSAFDMVAKKEPPMSIPISLCLLNAVHKCCQIAVSDAGHDAVTHSRGQGEGGESMTFYEGLADLCGTRSKLLFCSFGLYLRVKHILQSRDPTAQYLVHCMVMRLLGNHRREELLRLIISSAVYSALTSSISECMKLIEGSDGIPEDVSRSISFIGGFLAVYISFIHKGDPTFSSPLLWVLKGMHTAAGHMSQATASNNFFEAIMFLLLFQRGKAEDLAKEALIWIVGVCRTDINSAFETFITCVRLHGVLVSNGNMDGLRRCLRAVDQHLKLVRLTIDTSQSVDAVLLKQFDAVHAEFMAIDVKSRNSAGGTASITSNSDNNNYSGKKRKRLQNGSETGGDVLGGGGDSLEVVLHRYSREVREGCEQHSTHVIKCINTILADRWINRQSHQSNNAVSSVGDGAVASALNMLSLDKSVPLGFLGGDDAALLIRCLRDWAKHSCRPNFSKFNGFTGIGVETSEWRCRLLQEGYTRLVSAMGGGDSSEVLARFTNMQIEIYMSCGSYSTYSHTDTASVLPPVVNFINRTVLAIQIASELVVLSVDRDQVHVDTQRVWDMFAHHGATIVPAMLSYVFRWALSEYVQQDNPNSFEERIVKYVVGCLELCKLIPEPEIQCEIFDVALCSANFIENTTALDLLARCVYQTTDSAMAAVLYDVLSRVCEGVGIAVAVQANPAIDLKRARCCYALASVVGLMNILRFKLVIGGGVRNMDHDACMVSRLDVEVLASAVVVLLSVPTSTDSNSLFSYPNTPSVIVFYRRGGVVFEITRIRLDVESTSLRKVTLGHIEDDDLNVTVKRVTAFETAASALSSVWGKLYSSGSLVLPSFHSIFGSVSNLMVKTNDPISGVNSFITFLSHVVYLPLEFGNDKTCMCAALSDLYLNNETSEQKEMLLELLLATCLLKVRSTDAPTALGNLHWVVVSALRFIGVEDRVWSGPSEKGAIQSQLEGGNSDVSEHRAKALNMHLSKCFCAADKSRTDTIADFLLRLPMSVLCEGFHMTSASGAAQASTYLHHTLVVLRFLHVLEAVHGKASVENSTFDHSIKKVVTMMLCSIISGLITTIPHAWELFVGFMSNIETKSDLPIYEGLQLRSVFANLVELLRTVRVYFHFHKINMLTAAANYSWDPLTFDFISRSENLPDPSVQRISRSDSVVVRDSGLFSPVRFSRVGDMGGSAAKCIDPDVVVASPFRTGGGRRTTHHGTIQGDFCESKCDVDPIIAAPESELVARQPIITSPNGTRSSAYSPTAPVGTSKAKSADDATDYSVDLCSTGAAALMNECVSPPAVISVVAAPEQTHQSTFDLDAINKKFRRRG